MKEGTRVKRSMIHVSPSHSLSLTASSSSLSLSLSLMLFLSFSLVENIMCEGAFILLTLESVSRKKFRKRVRKRLVSGEVLLRFTTCHPMTVSGETPRTTLFLLLLLLLLETFQKDLPKLTLSFLSLSLSCTLFLFILRSPSCPEVLPTSTQPSVKKRLVQTQGSCSLRPLIYTYRKEERKERKVEGRTNEKIINYCLSSRSISHEVRFSLLHSIPPQFSSTPKVFHSRLPLYSFFLSNSSIFSFPCQDFCR